MFKTVTRTWNPATGCLFDCVYCWARGTAEGRLRNRYLANTDLIWRSPAPLSESLHAYENPFYPRFWPERLRQSFKPGERVFVVSMGDLFGPWVPAEWIHKVIDRVAIFPRTDFLFCTKNPARYKEFEFPSNVILGCTLETNCDLNYATYSKAPCPTKRYLDFLPSAGNRRFVSIEPITEFDIDEMLTRMWNLHPEVIEVGADSRHSHLPEPTPEEVRQLLAGLRAIPGVKVVEKQGLERLLK